VYNKLSGETKKFGIDHLQLHTGIDAKTANDILKGFDVVNDDFHT
jgi:hypothetical protein